MNNKKDLLVVVDMQNDFIDGALGTKEAQALVPRLEAYIKSFDGLIMSTIDTHTDSYLETLEGKKLPVKHCILGTEGWKKSKQILDAMSKKAGYLGGVSKTTFGSLDLLQTVAQHIEEISKIIVVGLCTDVCVISNACLLRAKFPDMEIVVPSDLTEGVTLETKKTSLEAMKMIQIDVI